MNEGLRNLFTCLRSLCFSISILTSQIRALIDRRCILSTYYHILHTFPIEEMCMGTTHPQIISGCHFSVDIFQKGLCINHLQLPISKCHFSFAVDWAKDKIAFIKLNLSWPREAFSWDISGFNHQNTFSQPITFPRWQPFILEKICD